MRIWKWTLRKSRSIDNGRSKEFGCGVRMIMRNHDMFCFYTLFYKVKVFLFVLVGYCLLDCLVGWFVKRGHDDGKSRA